MSDEEIIENYRENQLNRYLDELSEEEQEEFEDSYGCYIDRLYDEYKDREVEDYYSSK